VTAQYLDSTNVPDGFLPYLWAPVGLRYHALHHLLPSLPYHSLGEAHRRISGALGRIRPMKARITPPCADCWAAWRPAR
jgi:fatty acid desaturase